MKKIILIILITAIISATSFAQMGKVSLQVSPELTVPVGKFESIAQVGYGGIAKGLAGISSNGYITLTSGVSTYNGKASVTVSNGYVHFTIIPVLAGYRHYLNNFFLEPQLGVGIYKGKTSITKSNETAFTWAMGIGYKIKSFEIGTDFESGVKEGDTNNFFGFRIGYNFSLAKGQKK